MLVLSNAKIFSPDGNIIQGSITIEGDRIQRISQDGASPQAGQNSIDVQQRLVLPGFINAHSHLTFFRDAQNKPDAVVAFQAAAQAARALSAGITTVRDVGGVRHIDIALREAINEGKIPGPRLLVSGKFICRTGGHSNYYAREADGIPDILKAVREQLKAGADLIKFMGSGGVADPREIPDEVQFSFEELKAGIEEAHRARKTVAVHAHPPAAMKQAILAGADFIEHGTFITDEIIDLLLEFNVTLIPTFCVYKGISENPQLHPKLRDSAARVLDEKLQRFAKAVDAGIRWGVGLDNGTFYPHDGYALELELLVEAGVDPTQVLLAATENNARFLQLDQQLGTLEEGKFADLVVVPEASLQDVGLTRTPWLVVKGGEVIRKEAVSEVHVQIPERSI